MHVGHIVLGRPWEFDRKAIKDGFTKRYSFVMDNKPIALVHLTLNHVYEEEDQLRLKGESERKESELKK